MSKTKQARISNIEEQIKQLLAQKKQLIQKQKVEERAARTKRLCSRHGLLEKYMPELINITDEQFEMFIKRGINTSYGQKTLADIIAKSQQDIRPQNAETEAQPSPAPTIKPAETTTHGNNTSTAKLTETTIQSNIQHQPHQNITIQQPCRTRQSGRQLKKEGNALFF